MMGAGEFYAINCSKTANLADFGCLYWGALRMAIWGEL
jgi:hypothetical protein